MNKDLKTALVIVAVLLVMGVSTFFIGRYIGKKSEESGNKGKIPAETDWGTALSKSESDAAQKHAKALHGDMKGPNLWKRNMKIYTDYLATSDRLFVATANYFDDTYGKGENLAQWIDEENFFVTNLGDASDVADSILGRLAKFGILA